MVWVIVLLRGSGSPAVAGYGLTYTAIYEDNIVDGYLRPIVSIDLEKSGYALEKSPDNESEYILKGSGV